ncbi:MAG: hypothetical protein ACM3VZ_00855 [Acidobacteriota bacterium]
MICGNIWAKDLIVYPQPEAFDDHRSDYALELLRLALSEAGADVDLQPSPVLMMQERAFTELKRGNLHVTWVMTTRQREADALPIRIPIYKGLIGWRLPLVHASRSGALAGVRTLQQLAAFDAGQARDWPDTDILLANGLPVTTTVSYSGLFQMLGRQRFDYMPRSVVEVWDEAQAHRADGLIVDPHLVLHYQAAAYFFVNKQNTALAQKITLGLERALNNGKFNRLFYSYHAKAIEQAQISQRTVIELQNPLLPKETPLGRKELWLDFPANPKTPR